MRGRGACTNGCCGRASCQGKYQGLGLRDHGTSLSGARDESHCTRSDSTLLPARVIYGLKETLKTKVQCSLPGLEGDLQALPVPPLTTKCSSIPGCPSF